MRTPSAGKGQHPLSTSGTLAFWVVDKGSGSNVYDIFSGRNLEDATGMWATGLIGGAVTFSGTNNIEDVTTASGTDAATLQGAWSCEIWVRVVSPPGSTASILEYSDYTAALAADNAQLSIQLNADLTFRWLWQGTGTYSQNSTAKLRAGVWQHLAVTKESAGGGVFTVKTYLNGVLDNTQNNIQPPTGGSDAYWVMGNGKGGRFTGQVCSAHVTTSILTLSQIRRNWRRGMLWEDESDAGHGRTQLQVWVTPTWAGGTSYNLNNYLGFWDFITSVSIEESVDSQVASAQIGVKRSIYDINFSPTMTESMVNQNPQATIAAPGPASSSAIEFLALNMPLTIYALRQGSGSDDDATLTKAKIFEGTIDEVDWSSETIQLTCRDSGKALIDKYIETEAVYNSSGDQSIEATIQAILTANGTGVTLYTPTSPSFMLGRFTQRRESVMQACQTLADQIGWITKYRWDPLTEQFRFTLYDPERSRTRMDAIVSTEDYNEFTSVRKNMGNVRNKVRIVYSDSLADASGRRDDGSPIYPPATVTVQDATSITAFGTRFMEISESATSNIDTSAEATAMANAILSDLKDAETNIDLEIPYWEIELGDRLLFEENGEIFDTPQIQAVLSKTVAFTEGRGAISLNCKEAPANGFQRHLVKESGPGRALPPTVDANAGDWPDFGIRGRYAPISNLVSLAELLRVSPTEAGIQNPGFLVHPAGVGGVPTGWEIGSASWGSAGDVYFTTSNSRSGDRSVLLNTVGASVTSRWIPVIGGRVYEARLTWQAPDAGDQVTVGINYYDASRTATTSNVVITKTPTAINAWQVDSGYAQAGANDRWAKVVISKTAGPQILVDRCQFDILAEAFLAQFSGPTTLAAGSSQLKPDSEVYDIGAIYDHTTGTTTIYEPGWHTFHANAQIAPTGSVLSGAQLDMKVGGSIIWSSAYIPPASVSGTNLWLHTPRTLLASGDTVTFSLTISHQSAVTGTLSGGRNPRTDR